MITLWFIKCIPLMHINMHCRQWMDGAIFATYVAKMLVPELVPGTRVILNNLAIHKNTTAKMIRVPDVGCSTASASTPLR